MPEHDINLQVEVRFTARVSISQLSRAAAHALATSSQGDGGAVTVVITDDESVQEMNRTYRGVDASTDVLAFAAGEDVAPFVTPDDAEAYLGDVIISYPTAERQAQERGHPVAQELALLVVHGCLHLLGYDHADEEQRRTMWALQEQVLADLAREQRTLRRLLSGNEAVARGAWEAGVAVAAGYPGTPSTEILETLAPMPGVYAEWSPNEKVALDVAVGAAYAGARSIAVMKHVGLNVAADALFYAAMTGLEAGLVIVVADDPGMHSSQGEQDTRRYAQFARVPCLEPSDSQRARDMVLDALAISEQLDTPVILRLTTRIAHSHGVVTVNPERVSERTGVAGKEPPAYRLDPQKYVMVPGNARTRRVAMEEREARMAAFADEYTGNVIEMDDPALGIVTCGVAYQYAREAFPQASFLRLGMSYPLPAEMIAEFAACVERLIVIEELDPVIEEGIRLLGIPCEGKSIFPTVGELSPERVREAAVAAGLPATAGPAARRLESPPALPPRPPVLCPGCPHRGVFAVLRQLKWVVNGDIGCYTLGFAPPLGALHTCGCMGASIGVAHGVRKAGVREKNVAVIGDSTFFHSGLPALLNVAYNRSDTITLILDNRTTAMTGHQQHPGTGQTLQGLPVQPIAIEPLVRAMGIDRVATVEAYDLEGVERALLEAAEAEGPAVVIARQECALLPDARRRHQPLRIVEEKCIACGTCRRVGCPAISKSEAVYERTGRPKSVIDPLLCTGCEVCAQVCPVDAILTRVQLAATLEETV